MLVLCFLWFLHPNSLRGGSIVREVWTDIPGTAISDLTSDARFPNQPSSTNLVTDVFEAPVDAMENYGQRIHGYVLPPVSGDYTFWIASDDAGELWLSTDENPANQRKIAYVDGWTSSQEWTREANQSSGPIRLEAGRAYYVAALQKEGGGGDNLAVRWLRPDGVDEAPMPASYLLPWGTSFSAPRILRQPASAVATEGNTASFELQPDPLSPANLQWQRNGINVSGATATTLEYGPVRMADQNARFRAVLSNPLGTVTSAEAMLSVSPDVTPPTVIAVLNLGTTTVRVTFSEQIDSASAATPSNYRLNNGLSITSASAPTDGRTVLLTTGPMVFGTSYLLNVDRVRDQAASPNTIAAGTQVAFTAVEYVPLDIGAARGTTTPRPNGFDVTGSGADIGGASDQCHFAYQERTGDFDLRVQLEGLTVTDPYVQAGLMARESLEGGSRFAGVFASSAALGCFVESRANVSASTQLAAPTGGFPVNYPRQWLRLRRSGSQFTGYGSFDGTLWQQLGSVSLTLPSTVFFGMGVSSHDTNALATARFRGLSPVANPGAFTYVPNRERLGPSSRRTGLVFSEIMYHPASRADSRDLEFVEIYNAESVFVDLSGWRLTGAIQYSFPADYRLQAGQFAVIAAVPADLESVYGIQGVLGPYSGRLNNAGDTLQLLNRAGAVRLETSYSPDAPWPVAADGLGHSLVLSRPSFGEDDVRAWSASELVGGSPGEVDAIAPNPWAGVTINELLAHTDEPVLDFVELHNRSSASVPIGGCSLSDDPSTNRFKIPEGTVLTPGGFALFDQKQLGFALSAAGETVFLLAPDGTRVLDAIRFGGQENGVSVGRSPDGAPGLERLASVTPGRANAARRGENVVINEIMYHPISRDADDQYVELHNLAPQAVNLSGWRLRSGIRFEFPPNAVLPANGYVVVARDAARLRTNYAQLNAGNCFGDFSGALSRSGDTVVLTKPDTVVSTNGLGALETNVIHIAVSEVTYAEGGRWPELADGGGSSLELIDPRADLSRGSNWAASDETQKAPWESFERSEVVNLANTGNSNNRLQILMLGAGECLVDEVEVFRAGGTNLLANGGFENGPTGWSFFGNHRGSGVESTGALAGQNCLHVRGLGDGDTGNNSIRCNMSSTLPSSQVATIRAKVRWLAGWPEVLFRVRGNGIELPIRMKVPANLGTPGLANSRRVSNAGPAIFEVTHSPALPRANQAVVVSCRVSDPDGVAAPQLRYRIDPATTLTTVAMRDDGAGGDAQAGDGVYSATINGRSGGSLVAFRIQASDDAAAAATTVFPANAPTSECLIRWDDPVPFGTFAHYHMWNTAAVDQARNGSRALDNTYRDCTLVYGNFRIVYNSGFRDKGSPYHGGSGDFAVTVPVDELLLGAADRVFGSTGNGGSESTGMRGDVSAWIGEQLGIPFLHSHYMRLYRNGGQFREVLYDLEQPNRDYAAAWFGGGDAGDQLYKIAVWFEFADNNSDFQSTGATLERFLSGSEYKTARYRWNWQLRPSTGTATDPGPIFNLVTAANNSADRVTGLMNLANVDEWMRVFAFNRILGNWDSWTFSVGQNMYLYAPLGGRAVLLPWDVDFVLGDGNGVSDGLSGGQDPTANQLYNVPAYRRMLWRAYLDAINGPMRPEKYGPQVDARRRMLLKNGISGVSDPRGIKTYLDGRRNYLQNQLNAANASSFAVSSNGGADFSTNSPIVSLAGSAPFAVATIEVNGVPYPVRWTSATAWRVEVPLGAASNLLRLVGRDRAGQLVPGASTAITVNYTGPVPQAADWVLINEIMYHAPVKDAEFVEIYNRHPSALFDLSGWRLSGIDFTFAPGTVIAPNGYLVVAKDRAAFALAYGAQIPVAGEFAGRLDNGGETLRLIKPGPSAAEDALIDDVRYDSTFPWPTSADGQGPSLQLIDAAQDNWRPGSWLATSVTSPDRATPGRANAATAALDPYPRLWINEVLPNNGSGATDNQGERAPWIELFNAGASPLDLSGYFLSGVESTLNQWAFPPGSTLGAGQFLLVWADGQAGQTTPGSLHTSFRLDPSSGVVTLSRTQAGVPAAMDYVRYNALSVDRSVGSVPDGEPRKRRLLLLPTPGAANNPSSPAIPVFINEWLSSNQSGLLDPADSDLDDWFELYNAGDAPVDLGGFYLTSVLTNSTQFRIPNGTIIPGGGFHLVWADQEPGQGTTNSIHTNFRLPVEGGEIGLAGPDGVLIDSVLYPAQTPDVSQGRTPDGGPAPYAFFAVPTPGTENTGQTGNRPPGIDPIADVVISQGQVARFRALASDPDLPAQTLTFDLTTAPAGASIGPANGEFSWAPGTDVFPGLYSITVRVMDNGTPRRSASRTVSITLFQPNVPPVLNPIPNVLLEEGSLFSFQAVAQDSNYPPQKLTFSLMPNAPAGSAIDPVTGEFSWLPAEDQGPGTYSVTVQVTDDGQPALTAERTFSAVVTEVNNPPLVTPVSPQTIDEGSRLQIQVEARDPDNPPAALNYTLPEAPTGAAIDANSGLFTWTPTEADGPRDYNVTVRVNEVGGPSTTVSFLVGVRELNTPPTLQSIARFVVQPGDVLVFTNVAADADLPAQGLTFTALSGMPAGANLGSASGVFAWAVGSDPVAGTNLVTIRVTDDGVPALFAEQIMTIIVQAPPRVVLNEIMHRPVSSGAEFVELANASRANPVDLSGWRLEGYNYLFPGGTTLEPGGFLCVARDMNAFRTAYGNQIRVVGNAVVVLPGDGGIVRLLKPNPDGGDALVMDEVSFRLAAPWPAAAAQGGASLQLIDLDEDNRLVGNWAAASRTTTNTVIQAFPMTAVWRYWQEETNPGSSWNTLAFNDTTWPSGGALLYVESATLPAAKTTPLTLGKTTYYFRTRFNFTGNPQGARLRLSTIIDDGAIFYLNGQEVYRLAMPEGAVDASVFASRTVGDAALEGPFEVPAAGLRVGENVLAVEVHQINSGSSDIVLGVAGDLVTLSASSFTPGAPNSVVADLPAFPQVWINEVLPINLTGAADNAGDRDPWVELSHPGGEALSLAGWSLSDDFSVLGKWSFPADASIPGNGYLVVWADGETAESTRAALHAGFRLSSPAGRVVLARTQNGERAVVDYVEYNLATADQSWGALPDGSPFQRQVLTVPSPGAPNSPTVPSVPALGISLLPGSQLSLRCSTVPGVNYRLEATADLAHPDWQTVEAFAGDGTVKTFAPVVSGGQPQLYFRVRAP